MNPSGRTTAPGEATQCGVCHQFCAEWVQLVGQPSRCISCLARALEDAQTALLASPGWAELSKRVDDMQQPIGTATGDAEYARQRADEAMRVARDAVEHVDMVQKNFERRIAAEKEKRTDDAAYWKREYQNEFDNAAHHVTDAMRWKSRAERVEAELEAAQVSRRIAWKSAHAAQREALDVVMKADNIERARLLLSAALPPAAKDYK